MILSIQTVPCLQNDSNIASLDILCHLYVLSPQVLHQFRFTELAEIPNFKLTDNNNCFSKISNGLKLWKQKLLSESPWCDRKLHCCFFHHCQERSVKCTSSRGLQVDCSSHFLDWVEHSQASGPSSCDLKAVVLGCEAIKIKKLFFFPWMDQERLCSYFHIHHLGFVIRTSQQLPLSSKRNHSRESCMQGALSCHSEATTLRCLQGQTGPSLGSWRLGWEILVCLGLSLFL